MPSPFFNLRLLMWRILSLVFVTTVFVDFSLPLLAQESELQDASGEEPSGGTSGKSSATSSLFGDLQIGPLLAPRIPGMDDLRPPLKRESNSAFLAGRPAVALELCFGNMVTQPKKAVAEFEGVRYSAALKRPVWAIRWGVSLSVRGDLGADYGVITETMSPANRGGGLDRNDISSDPNGNEIGVEGDALGGAVGDDAAETEMSGALGLVSTVVGELFSQRFTKGDFGNALSAIQPPAHLTEQPAEQVRETQEEDTSSTSDGTPSDSETEFVAPLEDFSSFGSGMEPFPMWRPGIVYLGSISSEEALAKAKQWDLDFLLHFDVVIKEGRNGTVQNVSRCRLFMVSSEKALVVSKGLDSFEAAKAGTVPRDYVNEQVSSLFTVIDKQIPLVPMPKLSAEVAKRRVSSLFSGSKRDRMKALAEVRLYQHQGLLSDEDVEKAFHIIGGSEALKMLYGTTQDQIDTVHEWVTESFEVAAE